MSRVAEADPLSGWPEFARRVRDRLDAGRVAYGDRSFSAEPDALLRELQQEALDLAGWGFVLFQRIERMRKASAAAATTTSALPARRAVDGATLTASRAADAPGGRAGCCASPSAPHRERSP